MSNGLTELYPTEWMAAVDRRNRRAYRAVAGVIREFFSPESVLDVGCGTCAIANYLKREGVREVAGIDGSMASKELARDDVDWSHWDARTGPWQADRQFDVVICTEFAEHVPHEQSQHIVDTLTGATGKWLWFAACPPTPHRRSARKKLQHLNEQPQTYWLSRMQLDVDWPKTIAAKKRLVELGCDKQHYIDNVLIFAR